MGYGNGNPSGSVGYAILGARATPSTAAQAVRNSAIGEQLNWLEQGAEGLHSMLDELEARLSPILNPGPPTGADKEAPPPFSVPMAASLAQANMRFSQGLNRLQELIGRIDL